MESIQARMSSGAQTAWLAAPSSILTGRRLASLSHAALTELPLAMMLIDQEGPAFINTAAQVLLSHDRELTSGGTYGLTASSRSENIVLQRLIVEALSGRQGSIATITRGGSLPPILVTISPLRVEGEPPLALLLIHNGAGQQTTDHRPLIERYGLTEAESGVALAIISGHNAKRIARMRDVGVSTIRTQIRQVLSKTGCADQRQFISRFGWLLAVNRA